jgi:hypothetical protein
MFDDKGRRALHEMSEKEMKSELSAEVGERCEVGEVRLTDDCREFVRWSP